MDLNKTLVISGKPDLYDLVSQTKSGAIVESLVDKKRYPVFKTDKISSLNEISIFTTDDDQPLYAVLQAIYRKEEGKNIQFEIKKASSAELFGYFKEVLPSYDEERVHASDVKKILQWYNILNNAQRIDLENNKEETEENSEEKPQE